jgi:hypothetical protein
MKMSIRSSSILVDGTVAITAGTATSLISKGNDLVSHSAILDDSSEFIAQTGLSFTSKAPRVSTGAPNGYTQQRNALKINVPRTLANGNFTVDTWYVIQATDPETTAAQKASGRIILTTCLNDADYTAFWDEGGMD